MRKVEKLTLSTPVKAFYFWHRAQSHSAVNTRIKIFQREFVQRYSLYSLGEGSSIKAYELRIVPLREETSLVKRN